MLGKIEGKKEKGAVVDELFRQYHRLSGHEFEQTPEGSASGKEQPAKAGDLREAGLIPGQGKSLPPGEGNVTHPSIPAWKNPMDRGAWQATVHGFAELDMTKATQHKCTRRW